MAKIESKQSVEGKFSVINPDEFRSGNPTSTNVKMVTNFGVFEGAVTFDTFAEKEKFVESLNNQGELSIKLESNNVRVCPECGIRFTPKTAKQIYHDKKCAGKVRQRRYKIKHGL